MGYSVFTGAVLLSSGTGNPLAILLIFLVPGYLFVATLFPSRGELDWIERIGLSFGLSIAIVPLIALALNFTPFGTRFEPLVVAVTLFSVFFGFMAHRRRMNLPIVDRLSASLEFSVPKLGDDSLLEKFITVVLGASLVVAGGSLVYVLATQKPGERFTEFYLDRVAGNASGYPNCLNATQSTAVVIGVVNHEQTKLNYTVRVDLVGVRLVYNATAGVNETVETNRSARSTFDFSLDGEQGWTMPYTFSIGNASVWKVQFLLFKERDFAAPYRELQIFVRVPCS